MRGHFLAAALFALTGASPVPQDIDLDAVIAAPDPTFTQVLGATAQVVTYNTESLVAQATSVTSVTVTAGASADDGDVAARLAKRTACAVQPSGATGAPTVSTDTPAAFTNNAAFASLASNAPVPSGYGQTFQNLKGSNK